MARGRGDQFERFLEQSRRDRRRGRERAVERVLREAERGELERAAAMANEVLALLPLPGQRRRMVEAIAAAGAWRLGQRSLAGPIAEGLAEELDAKRRLPERPLASIAVLARLYAAADSSERLDQLAAELDPGRLEELVERTRALEGANTLRRRFSEGLLDDRGFWDPDLRELRDGDPRQASPFLGADAKGRAHLLADGGGAVCGAPLTGRRPPAGALIAARPPCTACLASLSEEHPAWHSEQARLSPALRDALVEAAARGIAESARPASQAVREAVRSELSRAAG